MYRIFVLFWIGVLPILLNVINLSSASYNTTEISHDNNNNRQNKTALSAAIVGVTVACIGVLLAVIALGILWHIGYIDECRSDNTENSNSNSKFKARGRINTNNNEDAVGSRSVSPETSVNSSKENADMSVEEQVL